MRISSVVISSFALAFCFSATSWAKGMDAKLVGSWQVVKWVKKDKEGTPPPGMQVKMTFKKNHSWLGELVHEGKKMKSETGTWTLKGDRLVTRSKKKPKGDVLKVVFKGGTLQLQKQGKPDMLVFKRVN